MRKIEFGYSNDSNPKGSWEGIGIKPGLLLPDADYYGAIKYEDNSYIVAKVVKDEYNRFPELLGKFIVRPAVADLYADGSGILYLDQEQTLISHQLENHLNNPYLQGKIKDINDVLSHCNGVRIGDKSFAILTLEDRFLATSIVHSEFTKKNEAIKSCRKSFSEYQLENQLSERNSFKR